METLTEGSDVHRGDQDSKPFSNKSADSKIAPSSSDEHPKSVVNLTTPAPLPLEKGADSVSAKSSEAHIAKSSEKSIPKSSEGVHGKTADTLEDRRRYFMLQCSAENMAALRAQLEQSLLHTVGENFTLWILFCEFVKIVCKSFEDHQNEMRRECDQLPTLLTSNHSQNVSVRLPLEQQVIQHQTKMTQNDGSRVELQKSFDAIKLALQQLYTNYEVERDAVQHIVDTHLTRLPKLIDSWTEDVVEKMCSRNASKDVMVPVAAAEEGSLRVSSNTITSATVIISAMDCWKREVQKHKLKLRERMLMEKDASLRDKNFRKATAKPAAIIDAPILPRQLPIKPKSEPQAKLYGAAATIEPSNLRGSKSVALKYSKPSLSRESKSKDPAHHLTDAIVEPIFSTEMPMVARFDSNGGSKLVSWMVPYSFDESIQNRVHVSLQLSWKSGIREWKRQLLAEVAKECRLIRFQLQNELNQLLFDHNKRIDLISREIYQPKLGFCVNLF